MYIVYEEQLILQVKQLCGFTRMFSLIGVGE